MKHYLKLALALAAYLFLPAMPLFRAVLPVSETLLLLLPIVAVCAVIGWGLSEQKSNPFLAIIWILLAIWIVLDVQHGSDGGVKIGLAQSAYSWLSRGWAVLLAASFGLACVLLPKSVFFTRALAALGAATLLAFALVVSAPNGLDRITKVVSAELTKRTAESIAELEQVTRMEGWQRLAKRSRVFGMQTEQFKAQISALPEKAAVLAPALLILESLAALALAWALYHRFFQAPIGPGLARLKEFRFNDQLVWGLAVGATIYLLPGYAEGKVAGLNLLLFFGMLFVVRGLGVTAWMLKQRTFVILMIVVGIFAWPLLAMTAFGLGLGDTWLDWRSRPKKA